MKRVILRQKMKERWKSTDDAVVGIVTAILIIGLVAAVISIVQTTYVPKIMEQREAEHMDKVAEQFASLTSVIDGQAAEEKKGIPIATSVTLGSRELPFLVSSKSYGTLEILENSCNITIRNQTKTQTYHLGTITYSSANAYYIDQSYTYETGAMIVSQTPGNLMMIPPEFLIEYNGSSNLSITFNVVNISSIPQKMMAAGFGSYPIQTEFREISTIINYTQVENITIATRFSNAWSVLLNNSLTAAGLNWAGYGTHFLLSDTGQATSLEFTGVADPLKVTLNFRIIEIRAQIGPGWVE